MGGGCISAELPARPSFRLTRAANTGQMVEVHIKSMLGVKMMGREVPPPTPSPQPTPPTHPSTHLPAHEAGTASPPLMAQFDMFDQVTLGKPTSFEPLQGLFNPPPPTTSHPAPPHCASPHRWDCARHVPQFHTAIVYYV